MTTSAIANISPEAAQAKIEAGEAAVIDVRMPYDWAGERIPNSINLPLQAIRFRKGEVPEDKELIFVAGEDKRSQEAAEAATNLGFERVYVLSGGIEAWSHAGLPMDTIG